MARKSPLQILRDDASRRYALSDVIHVDHSGIYTVEGPAELKIWSLCSAHNIAVYSNTEPEYIRGVITDHSGPRIVHSYYSIYTISDQNLINRHRFRHEHICAVDYHPFRETYIVATTSGKIFEHSVEIDQPILVCHQSSTYTSIVSSVYSANIYTTWYTNPTAGINVIRDGKVMAGCRVKLLAARLPTLLARSEHPEALVLMHGSSIWLIDLWHSSFGNRHICSAHASAFAVNVGPNTCITSGSGYLCVVDYRYGLVQSRHVRTGESGLWLVGDKLYARGREGLTIFDV